MCSPTDHPGGARQTPMPHPHDVREHRGTTLEGRVETCRRSGSRALVLTDKPLPSWAERKNDTGTSRC
jgi:hypothetical protein